MWSSRYAMLRGNKLILVRGKKEEMEAAAAAAAAFAATASASFRAEHNLHPGPPTREFILMSGSYVSDVRELPNAAGKGKSLWMFRLHWPEGVKGYGLGARALSKGVLPSPVNRRAKSDGEDQEEEEDDYDEYIDASYRGGAGRVPSPPITPSVAGTSTTAAAAAAEEGGGVRGEEKKGATLQELAVQAAHTAKQQRTRAADIERAESHHQSLVTKGAGFAGVVVGGVVIGALTAGVGLLPYLGLVGAAAVAGGGAVAYTAAQAPSESRVVLAAETEAEARRWKGALELQIAVCEGRRPPPPPEIDLLGIDELIRSTAWRAVRVLEGVRVLEEEGGGREGGRRGKSKGQVLCRKVQVMIEATPIEVFMACMATEGPYRPPSVLPSIPPSAFSSTPLPPSITTAATTADHSSLPSPSPPPPPPFMRRIASSFTTIQRLDDHTDILHIRLRPPSLPSTPLTPPFLRPILRSFLHRFLAPRDFCVLRYWRLDDDGAYIICLASVEHPECPVEEGREGGKEGGLGTVRGTLQSVLSIAPRKDYADYEEDLPEALVSYIVEVDPGGWVGGGGRGREGGWWWNMGRGIRAMYADVVLAHILDVKEEVDAGRFRGRDGVKEEGGEEEGRTPMRQSLTQRLYEKALGPVRTSTSTKKGKKKSSSSSSSSSSGSGSGDGSMRQRKRMLSPMGERAEEEEEEDEGGREGGKGQQRTTTSVTAEAAALRNALAAKEFEVHRLEREIGRGGGTAMGVGGGAVLTTGGAEGGREGGREGLLDTKDRSLELFRRLQEQVNEVERLKRRYRSLTGLEYGLPFRASATGAASLPACLPPSLPASSATVHAGSGGGDGAGKTSQSSTSFLSSSSSSSSSSFSSSSSSSSFFGDVKRSLTPSREQQQQRQQQPQHRLPTSPLSAARKALMHRSGGSSSPRKGGKSGAKRGEGQRGGRKRKDGGREEELKEEEEEENGAYDWNEGVPDHWTSAATTRRREEGRKGGMVSMLAAALMGEGEGGGEGGNVLEEVEGTFVGLLIFCALLFLSLSLRAQVL